MANLEQLASLEGMPSVNTLRILIKSHADFPVIRHGGHGVPYQLDVNEVERFIRQLREPAAPDPAARAAMIDQLGLTMIAKGAPDE